MKIKLSADDDSIDITDLYIANTVFTYSNTDLGSTGIDSSSNRIQTIKLFVDGTQIASKVPANGKVHFDLGSSNAIRVAKNSNKIVSVRVDLNPVTDDSNTGKEFKLALYALEAKSVATGTDLVTSDIVGVSDSETTGSTNASSNTSLIK